MRCHAALMRVVSHSCSNTEIICALGCAQLLVGVDDHSDYPPAIVAPLPRVGADLDVDPDKVAALKPDLVVASDTVPGHERVIARLKSRDLPLLVTAPRSITDIAADMISIATALQVPDRGRRLAHDFLHQIEYWCVPEAERRTQPAPVLLEWWPKPVIVPAQQSWATQLITMAGGHNPWADQAQASLEISTRQAQLAAPQLIIMSWCGVDVRHYRPHIVARRKDWEAIPAVRTGQIHAISEAWLGRPGPRLVQGLQALRQLLQNLPPNLP